MARKSVDNKKLIVSLAMSREILEMAKELAQIYDLSVSAFIEKTIRYVYENNLEDAVFVWRPKGKVKSKVNQTDTATIIITETEKPKSATKPKFKIKL